MHMDEAMLRHVFASATKPYRADKLSGPALRHGRPCAKSTAVFDAFITPGIVRYFVTAILATHLVDERHPPY
jgi:hypothetical protein